MVAFLLKLWAFATSKIGMILGAIGLVAAAVLTIYNKGYDKRVTQEKIENAKARERMEQVPTPTTDDTVDRLRNGTF